MCGIDTSVPRHPEDDRLRRGEYTVDGRTIETKVANLQSMVSILKADISRLRHDRDVMVVRVKLMEQQKAAMFEYIEATSRKPEYPCGYDERPEDCGGQCAPKSVGGDCPMMLNGASENELYFSMCDHIAAEAKAYERLAQALETK